MNREYPRIGETMRGPDGSDLLEAPSLQRVRVTSGSVEWPVHVQAVWCKLGAHSQRALREPRDVVVL